MRMSKLTNNISDNTGAAGCSGDSEVVAKIAHAISLGLTDEEAAG
jgi:hypothetical protein